LSSIEHRCEWREKAEKLEAEVTALETQVGQMETQLERVGQLEQTVASL